MNLPLQSLEFNPRDYENADVYVKNLANFCAELLSALKYSADL